MMLSARLLLAPNSLSNILLALLIALIALAYLEEDGVVLSIGLLVGFVVLAVDLVVVWGIIDGAKRVGPSGRDAVKFKRLSHVEAKSRRLFLRICGLRTIFVTSHKQQRCA